MDEPAISSVKLPDSSSLLGRRVGAGLIDLAAMALMTMAAVFARATRIPAVDQPDGSMAFAPSDQQLIGDMTGPLSRGHLIGDTLWAFSTFDVGVVVSVSMVAGLIVGVVVPRFTGGRSPGKVLLRLRVLTVDGGRPGITRHLIRTVASAADLMPGVVPGLTGYAFAASNPLHQRIGDRLAGTIVVESSLNRRQESPDLVEDEAASPPRTDTRTDANPVGRRRGAPGSQSNGDTVDMNDRDTASEQPVPPVPATAQIPVEERSNNPYPKPVRRPREVSPEATLTDFESLTLPESSLSDMPLTNNALFEALGLRPPDETDEDATDIDGDEARSMADTTPERPSRGALQSKGAPATEPQSHIQRRRDETTPIAASTALETRRGSSPAADKRAPIWSEDWDAWIYWDTTLECWFRFDAGSGDWVPMDDD